MTKWTSTTGGDWNTAADWNTGVVPTGTAALATLPGVPSAAYTVSIAAGESEIVNAVTLGDLLIANHGPTLDVAGTLTFGGTGAHMAFLSGAMGIDGGGVLAGAGILGGIQGPGPFVLVNNGTVLGDGGRGKTLTILVGFNNAGTVLADNGLVELEGTAGVANLSGDTLTGGSWIAQGLTAGTDNQIQLGFHFKAVITTDAANIVLDGVASDMQGYAGGAFQPIEHQLQTIAPSGTLQLLDSRGYITSNTLEDAGLLTLHGSMLATAGLTVDATGTLTGFGVVSGPVVDQGDILANDGALTMQGTIAGSGALTIGAGDALIVTGATPSAITNDGAIYETTGGLLDINALSGSGTLVVEGGGAIEVGVTTAESIVFSGGNAEVIFDSPLLFGGTLAGFGSGDRLLLSGVSADSAIVVNSNTLAVISSGTTVETVTLSGNYAGATFSTRQFSGFSLITNTAGAPPRDDMAFTISVSNTTTISTAQQGAIVNDLSAAALDWAKYITGHAPLRIQLDITSGAHGSELATGGFASSIPSGQMIGGETVVVPSSIYALTTGNYLPGSTADVLITLPLSGGELDSAGGLFAAPEPLTLGDPLPSNEFDLISVFRHELAHGLGFSGLTTQKGTLGSQETLFDSFIQNTGSAASFIGPNAEAAYGAFLGTGTATPVPLTLLNNNENFFHVANGIFDPLAQDLMSGLGFGKGQQRDISSVDLAMLQDVGAPVPSTTIVCFARGTRIATPAGDVAVEELRLGQLVGTASGGQQPIVWIGRRRIDCILHPGPRLAWPVRIGAHAFGEGLPRRDLWVSPQHALFLHGVLIPARYLIDGDCVAQVPVAEVEYWHIELPRHDVVLAEGLPAESYLDCGDRAAFDDGAVIALYPDFGSQVWESRACAPLKVAGPEVEAVRSVLRRFAGDRSAAWSAWSVMGFARPWAGHQPILHSS